MAHSRPLGLPAQAAAEQHGAYLRALQVRLEFALVCQMGLGFLWAVAAAPGSRTMYGAHQRALQVRV